MLKAGPLMGRFFFVKYSLCMPEVLKHFQIFEIAFKPAVS